MTFLASLTEAPEHVAEIGEIVRATSGVVSLSWLILLLPLFGFVAIIAAGRRLGEPDAGYVALGTSVLAFALSVLVYLQVLAQPPGARRFIVPLFSWLDIGEFQVRFDLLIDPLTAVMLLIVTGVGALVHLYSLGYMHGDERYGRFFAYLNLVLFSMLTLVLGSSLLTLFVGWELVGLSSYLLIGFWFENRAFASAAKKAFITNRVGDVSLMIAMFLAFATFGTLDFFDFDGHGILQAAGTELAVGGGVALALGLLLLGGAVGKSAQLPLFVWLPDAMAGPTPVSALMHAATMVTAGVYLIARTSAIYIQSIDAMTVVAWTGALTALLAALIAMKQDEIKKILAYSTVSQLGYMFIGVGTGGFSEGIFHLVTHAFFKGLLFLAAGSVLHALANRGDIWQMGGLRKHMPITFATSAVAWLAISGVPPFAGFFSKDQILTTAYEHGFTAIWAVGLVVAVLTAFYMSRWFFVIFLGEERFGRDVHPHESPGTMTIPLLVLAVLSAVGGAALNFTHHGPFHTWLSPYLGSVPEESLAAHGPLGEPALIAISIVAAAIGIAVAAALYVNPGREDRLRGGVFDGLRDRLYIDELYASIFVGVGGRIAAGMAWFDTNVIDGLVNGAGAISTRTAGGLRRAQTGLVRSYVVIMVAGAVAVIAALMLQAR